MKKARSLREALIKAVPQLETNPEMMRIFADEGNIDARLAASLSLTAAKKATVSRWI